MSNATKEEWVSGVCRNLTTLILLLAIGSLSYAGDLQGERIDRLEEQRGAETSTVTVETNTPIIEAIRMMIDNRIDMLPVIEQTGVVGIMGQGRFELLPGRGCVAIGQGLAGLQKMVIGLGCVGADGNRLQSGRGRGRGRRVGNRRVLAESPRRQEAQAGE